MRRLPHRLPSWRSLSHLFRLKSGLLRLRRAASVIKVLSAAFAIFFFFVEDSIFGRVMETEAVSVVGGACIRQLCMMGQREFRLDETIL